MRPTLRHRPVWSVLLFSTILAVLLLSFSHIFPELKKGALYPSNHADTPINIPQNLNFISEDKQAFLKYCGALVGKELTLTVDSDTFSYEGAVDGYHLYRIQAKQIETGSAHQKVLIGGYWFESDRLYRPSATGLYLIKDNQVYTLEEAYQYQLVDFSGLYQLYLHKDSDVVSGAGSTSS